MHTAAWHTYTCVSLASKTDTCVCVLSCTHLTVHGTAHLAGQAGGVPQPLAAPVPHRDQHSLHTAAGRTPMQRKDQPAGRYVPRQQWFRTGRCAGQDPSRAAQHGVCAQTGGEMSCMHTQQRDGHWAACTPPLCQYGIAVGRRQAKQRGVKAADAETAHAAKADGAAHLCVPSRAVLTLCSVRPPSRLACSCTAALSADDSWRPAPPLLARPVGAAAAAAVGGASASLMLRSQRPSWYIAFHSS